MVKSCREIAEDIDELRRKIQQDKFTEMVFADFSERTKCKSSDFSVMCKKCNCWKAVYNDKDALEN
ncbi:MAG: hypothetical protein [Caudoviricetes sp.]|jgi:hypothetical protein|nr:MAG: hypothetical protein [Caudoviricetes sp.]